MLPMVSMDTALAPNLELLRLRGGCDITFLYHTHAPRLREVVLSNLTRDSEWTGMSVSLDLDRLLAAHPTVRHVR